VSCSWLDCYQKCGRLIVGAAKPQDLEDNELISIAHRLTTLEMKELNERQRAEHASHMYEQQKSLFRQLEDRNFELEHKFAEVKTGFFRSVGWLVRWLELNGAFNTI